MTKLLEQIESRLAAISKWSNNEPMNDTELHGFVRRIRRANDLRGMPLLSSEHADVIRVVEEFRKVRNQREGELAALKCAVEALEKPYICSVCGDRSKEKCGRVCDGDESSCCKYFLNFDQALAQITKLMGEGK